MIRIICLLIGYGFGNFLTAELVVQNKLGKHPEEIGSGNPGMANVTGQLGILPGLMVLVGDIGKTIIACVLCGVFLSLPHRLSILYAGLGVLIGHNFPFWKHFKGGKGVAVTCILLVLYSPGYGFLACIIGGILVLLTKYLPIGAITIPIVFLVPAFFRYGSEAGILAMIITILMLYKHYPSLVSIWRGTCPKVNLIGKLTKYK
ncbi:glycerol-3-phosphate acyltransferase [Blautia liquoris]|uniref:Glycerol-3-phosphate acyltransferase n=1 Tax=Blautia liquoris TaxID=2779518 RepID=A0A7M2RKV0_9FIRM|nr:glycerol-3-phosphate acyltransferase [Blautia liquoris]QOV19972.1 glycerol-3-phosphate acyltransferase [Blautia liquoris]